MVKAFTGPKSSHFERQGVPGHKSSHFKRQGVPGHKSSHFMFILWTLHLCISTYNSITATTM